MENQLDSNMVRELFIGTIVIIMVTGMKEIG